MEQKLENIDNLFREGLGSYTELPPPSVWDALEERLDKDKKRPGFFYRWSWFVLLLAFFGAGGAAFFAWKTAGSGNGIASQPIAASDASAIKSATTPDTERNVAGETTTGKKSEVVSSTPENLNTKQRGKLYTGITPVVVTTANAVASSATEDNNLPVAEKIATTAKPVSMDQAIALNSAPASDAGINDVPQPTKTAVIKYIVKNSTHNNIAIAESEPVFVNVRDTKADNLISNPVEDDEEEMTFGSAASKAKIRATNRKPVGNTNHYAASPVSVRNGAAKSVSAIAAHNKNVKSKTAITNTKGSTSNNGSRAVNRNNEVTVTTTAAEISSAKKSAPVAVATTVDNSVKAKASAQVATTPEKANSGIIAVVKDAGNSSNTAQAAAMRSTEKAAKNKATKSPIVAVEKSAKKEALNPAATAVSKKEKVVAIAEKPAHNNAVEKTSLQQKATVGGTANRVADGTNNYAAKPALVTPAVASKNAVMHKSNRHNIKATPKATAAKTEAATTKQLEPNSARVAKGNDVAAAPNKAQASATKKSSKAIVTTPKEVAAKQSKIAKKHTPSIATAENGEDVFADASLKGKSHKSSAHNIAGVTSKTSKANKTKTTNDKPAFAAGKNKQQKGNNAATPVASALTKKAEPAMAVVTTAAAPVPQAAPPAPKPAVSQNKDSIPAAPPATGATALQNDSPVARRKRFFSGIEVGVKAGYEGSFAAGGAQKFVVTPFLEKKLSSKFSLLVQPGIKYAGLSSHKLNGTASYIDADNNSTVYRNDSFIVVDTGGTIIGWLHYDTATQKHTSVVKSYAVSGSYLEFDFPILLKYNVTSKFSVYGGANLTYSKLIGIKEATTTGASSFVTADTTYFTPGNTPAAHPLANSYMAYAATPLSGYKGPLYPSPTGGAFRIGYMFGFSYQLNKRWLADVLVQQASVKANMQGGYNVNTALSQNYFRFTIGYKLFQ